MCLPLLDTPRFFLENQPANHFKNLSRLDLLKLFRKQVWIPPEVQGNRLYSGEIHFRFFHEKIADWFSNKKCSQRNSLSQLTNNDNVQTNWQVHFLHLIVAFCLFHASERIYPTCVGRTTSTRLFISISAKRTLIFKKDAWSLPLQLFENQHPFGKCALLSGR